MFVSVLFSRQQEKTVIGVNLVLSTQTEVDFSIAIINKWECSINELHNF